jgi:ribonuclease D
MTNGALLYLKTQEELLSYLESIKDTPLLAIDTEFVREKTYWPQLCLLQLATKDTCVIIDPFTVESLEPLRALLENENMVKVMHAGDQDCAILLHSVGCLPRPVFDTQRASLLFGYANQLGLAATVKAFCHVVLDKTDTFSDWERRPLTQAQVEYALNDVRYLPQVYQIMVDKLSQSGRLEWLQEDFARMSDESTYRISPYDRWQKVKKSANMSPRQLAVVREVAAWREGVAARKDYPRKWVITDEMIVEIAKREPSSAEELYLIRGLKDKLGNSWTVDVLAAVSRAQALPEDKLPHQPQGRRREPQDAAVVDMLSALLHCRARQEHVAPQFIATHDDLLKLVGGEREHLPLLQGWRQRLVGGEMLDLLAGHIALSLADNHIKVTKLPQ